MALVVMTFDIINNRIDILAPSHSKFVEYQWAWVEFRIKATHQYVISLINNRLFRLITSNRHFICDTSITVHIVIIIIYLSP